MFQPPIKCLSTAAFGLHPHGVSLIKPCQITYNISLTLDNKGKAIEALEDIPEHQVLLGETLTDVEGDKRNTQSKQKISMSLPYSPRSSQGCNKCQVYAASMTPTSCGILTLGLNRVMLGQFYRGGPRDVWLFLNALRTSGSVLCRSFRVSLLPLVTIRAHEQTPFLL